MVIRIRFTYQTLLERLVARNYYVSGALCSISFVVPRPLTEPDKRISHTSGSSVRHSESLRSTTRVQVYSDFRRGPSDPGKGADVGFPRICPPLALAVEPFEQDAFRVVGLEAAPILVVRYGVIAQMADHSGSCQS